MKDSMKYSVAELELEMERVRMDYMHRFWEMFRETVYILLIVIATSLLIATLIFPILKVCGDADYASMETGNIVLVMKTSQPKQENVIACWYKNKIVIRSVVGLPGDEITMAENGRLSVNGKTVQGNYISSEKNVKSDLAYPFVVPESSYFVLSNAESGMDSRLQMIGCIQEEDIIGKIAWRIWPLSEFGWIKSGVQVE